MDNANHWSFIIYRLSFIIGRLSLVVGFSLLVASIWRGTKNIEDMSPALFTVQSISLVTNWVAAEGLHWEK